jgi:hypothetical protein
MLVVIESKDERIIARDDFVFRTVYDSHDITDPRSIFFRVGNKFEGLDELSMTMVNYFLETGFSIVPISELPLSIYVSVVRSKTSIRATANRLQDHPIVIAAFSDNPTKMFKRCKRQIPDYEPCESVEVYGRFKFISEPKHLITVGLAGFNHTWLLQKTDFAEHVLGFRSRTMFDCMTPLRNADVPIAKLAHGVIVEANVLNWNWDSIRLNDDVNSVYAVVYHTHLSDDQTADFIARAVHAGLSLNVIVENNPFRDRLLNRRFRGKVFSTVLEDLYEEKSSTSVVQPVFMAMLRVNGSNGSRLQEFCSGLNYEMNPIRAYAHSIRYFSKHRDVHRHVMPAFEFYGIRYDKTIILAMMNMRTVMRLSKYRNQPWLQIIGEYANLGSETIAVLRTEFTQKT